MEPSQFRFSGYLEPEEVRAVINAISQVSKYPERDSLLLELLWQSGGRVSEVIVLVPERIGMTSVILDNLKQKKKSLIKEVEISGELCQKLKDYCTRNHILTGEYIFRTRKGHISRWYVWNIVNKAAEEAHVYRFGKRHPRTGGRFKGAFPHLFRHSNAMYLLEQTGDITIVKEQLGHSRISTTQGYAYAKRPKIKREISKIEW